MKKAVVIGVLAAIQEPERFGKLILVGPSPRYVNDGDYVGGFGRQDIDGLLDAVTGAKALPYRKLVDVTYDEARVKVFGSAVHLSGSTAAVESKVPMLYEHNEAIYLDWLGLDRKAFDSLRESKVI